MSATSIIGALFINNGIVSKSITRLPNGLLAHTKTALSMLGALELDQLCLDVFNRADGNYKFLNLVSDGSSVNKLAVRMLVCVRAN